MNEEPEERLEMLVPRTRLDAAIEALRDTHPYEEPAFDVIGVERPEGWGLGLGRLGEVDGDSGALTLAELAERCRSGLGSRPRVVGDPARPIRRVAMCGGSGASLHRQATAAGADVLVTADVKHHEALEALAAGQALIDAGHVATEFPWIETEAGRLDASFRDVEVRVAAAGATDPFVTESEASDG